jgi:hypothetical protein
MSDIKYFRIPFGIFTKKEEFLKKFDEIVGYWPAKASSLAYCHGTDEIIDGVNTRQFWFCSGMIRNEWNTSYITADEYYWFKLSEKSKSHIENQIRTKVMNNLTFNLKKEMSALPHYVHESSSI